MARMFCLRRQFLPAALLSCIAFARAFGGMDQVNAIICGARCCRTNNLDHFTRGELGSSERIAPQDWPLWRCHRRT
jgi:hypothetical protein